MVEPRARFSNQLSGKATQAVSTWKYQIEMTLLWPQIDHDQFERDPKITKSS